MAAHTFKLSKSTLEKIKKAKEAIDGELTDLRDAFSEMSERWQEGDSGVAVDGWLDELETLSDDLDNVNEEPS